MNSAPSLSAPAGRVRSARFHQWRSRKDQLVRWLIAIGGIAVLCAIILIFFYLLWVVFPVFLPASSELGDDVVVPRWAGTQPVYLSVEEQEEVGIRLTSAGVIEFFEVAQGLELESSRLPAPNGSRVIAARNAIEINGKVAAAVSTGEVFVFRHQYETRFDGGVETRRIIPELTYPYGPQPLMVAPGGDVRTVAFSDSDRGLVIAVAGPNRIWVNTADKAENFLTGDISLEPEIREFSVEVNVTALAVSGDHQWLYLGDDEGRVHFYRLSDLDRVQTVDLNGEGISKMTMLLGGISLLAGDSAGRISQLFPVRNGQDHSLQLIRQFDGGNGSVVEIVPEARRKGFLVLTSDRELSFFYSTAERLAHRRTLVELQPTVLALAPRAGGLLIESEGGLLTRLHITNRHPEVSFTSLWRKVWYENYEQPEHVWQSSAANNAFEPKFSLTPLVFGTIKAAAFAMLFAVPIALMGAAYTAYFMSPAMRRWVKPGIEIMAAMPTVVIGFLAGLWFAPWVEANLAALFLIFLVLPPGLLAAAWIWSRLQSRVVNLFPRGCEFLLLIPALVILAIFATWLAGPVQNLFFQGDLRAWLSEEAGISYDQRNALVVGIAMGFAVIPTIFSIAEDAIYGVPESLSNGSLALGATPWQSLVSVVLPTASPGIFSALIIGMGRAVGETMIVLMATGNTPIMDWNLFEGMRTLAANIAIEMPESEVNSTHYRVLFMAALVLFVFTFAINTGAEFVRHRLRGKYGSI